MVAETIMSPLAAAHFGRSPNVMLKSVAAFFAGISAIETTLSSGMLD